MFSRTAMQMAVVGVALAFASSCADGPSSPTHGEALFKKGGKGGGNGPSPDPPLTVDLSAFAAATMGNDGLGSYTHDIDGVSAVMFNEDHMNLDIDPVGRGKKAKMVRTICFDFTQRVDPGVGIGLPFSTLCTDGAGVPEVRYVLWNTSDQRDATGTPVELGAMAPGDVIGADSRLIVGLLDSGPLDGMLKVRFGDREGQNVTNACGLVGDEGITRVTVTALGDSDGDGNADAWHIDAPAKVAAVTRAPPHEGFVECRGRYEMSWSATLTKN